MVKTLDVYWPAPSTASVLSIGNRASEYSIRGHHVSVLCHWWVSVGMLNQPVTPRALFYAVSERARPRTKIPQVYQAFPFVLEHTEAPTTSNRQILRVRAWGSTLLPTPWYDVHIHLATSRELESHAAP